MVFAQTLSFLGWVDKYLFVYYLIKFTKISSCPTASCKEVCHEEILFSFDVLFSSSFVLLRLQVFGI